MASSTHSETSTHTQSPTIGLDRICDRLELVDIRGLRFYEEPDQQRVAEIVRSLTETEHLVNPVVVDERTRLLIDGHHRVTAFGSLGFTRIPAFLVDYQSDEVSVRGWAHATDASPEERAAVMKDERPSPGAWAVDDADGEGQVFSFHEFPTAKAGAEALKRRSEILRRKKHTVTLMPGAMALRLGLGQSYIRPVVGKAEVIEAIEGGEVFPDEVNRHLIEERPLHLWAPLDSVEDADRFRRLLSRVANEEQAVACADGFQEGERVYEERVNLLRSRPRRR